MSSLSPAALSHSKTDGERETTSNHAPFTWECAPRGNLCGTNQIEATMLKVYSTNEKAGQNPLTEAEGQTKLSLPAILNVHGGGNDQHNCAFN